MKNIQIIDGAVNSTFEIYSVEDDIFNKIFNCNKDIAFISDLKPYIDFEKEENRLFWEKVYSNKANKKLVQGIHGTLHLDDSWCKKEYFPERQEDKVK